MENERLFLSDVMTSREQQEIIEGDFIKLIVAGTGAGKSFFLVNELVDRLTYEGRNILFLANRTALRIQFVKDIEENARINFGKKVEVLCYQTLINTTAEDLANEFDYIIGDECHFILADATFNEDTDKVLKLLLDYQKINKDGLLFVTATPFELLSYLTFKGISEEEGNIKVYNYDKELNFYDRINLVCTSKKYMDIAKTIPDDEKCLIFLKAKSKMRDICDKLGNADFIHTQWKDGDSLEKDEEMSAKINNLIEKKTFDTKFLVTNATLDNGINIVDDKLKTIIIDNIYDLVAVIQMIGRKRFLDNNPNDKVTVYLISNIKNIFDELNQYKSYIRMYKDFKEDNTERKMIFRKKYGKFIDYMKEKNKKAIAKEPSFNTSTIKHLKKSPLLPVDCIQDTETDTNILIVRETLVAKASYLVDYYSQLINMVVEDEDIAKATLNIHKLSNINYNRAKRLAEQYGKSIDEIVIDRGNSLKKILNYNKSEQAKEKDLIPYLESLIGTEIYGDIKDKFRRTMRDKYGIATQVKKAKKLTKEEVDIIFKPFITGEVSEELYKIVCDRTPVEIEEVLKAERNRLIEAFGNSEDKEQLIEQLSESKNYYSLFKGTKRKLELTLPSKTKINKLILPYGFELTSKEKRIDGNKYEVWSVKYSYIEENK